MKKTLWTLVTLFALSAVLILFLPMIASTKIGKKVIESAISQRIDGDVDIGSWELSWFGPQVIRNAKFKNDEVEFSFSEIQAKLPFWAFMTVSQLKEPFLNELDGDASLKNGNIILYDKSESTTTYIENIDVNLYGNEGEDINFDLKGDSKVGQIIGSILIDGKIAKTSNFIESPFPATVKVITVNFPTKSLDKFFQVSKLNSKSKLLKKLKKEPNFFFSTLGPKINANLLIKGKNNEGTLALEMLSTNLKVNLDGLLENNKIYLNKDLDVTYFPSDSFDNKLIENLSPLFANVKILNPVTLTVFKEGFVSSYDMSIKDLKIPKATLDIGKIKCKNTKMLATVIGLFKLQKLEGINDVTLWCTPLTFEIRDKTLIADRMDALIADSIHVCIYGDVNLINDKIDMILGIPTDTLEELLKIKSLPSNYVFQIPLKGKLDSPKINLSRVTSKLALLITTEKKTEKIPDTQELLDILEKFDEKKTPPPNQAFPWQKKG